MPGGFAPLWPPLISVGTPREIPSGNFTFAS
jgi:hypothetical protein